MNRSLKRRIAGPHSEKGVVLIVTVLCMALMATACAFAVDLGRNVVINRSLQSIADSGALDSALYLDDGGLCSSGSTEASTISTNGQPIGSLPSGFSPTVTAIPGSYVGTTFTKYASPCNAVKTTASDSMSNLFVSGSSSLTRSAIAALTPFAGFDIGTYVTNVSTQQSTVLNTLLGNLSGHSNQTAVSISGIGYNGLATTGITISQLISANSSVLSTSNILTASYTDVQWATFLSNAVTAVSGSNTSLTSLITKLTANSHTTSTTLCSMISTADCTSGSVSVSGLSTTINVLQVLTAEAELANGTNAIALTSLINLGTVTTLLNSLLNATIGTPSLVVTGIQKPVYAYGPVPTSASTTQVTATLTIPLNLTLAGITLASLPIVIPLNVAQGTAKLSSVTCNNDTFSQDGILVTTTGVSNNVTVGGLQATTITALGNTQTDTYAASVVPPTSATITAGTNPVTSGSFGFGTVNVSSGLDGLLPSVLDSIVGNVLSPLSLVLGPVLQLFGISLAGAQVATISSNCGAASLVQ